MNTVMSPDARRSHTATASNAPGASQHAPTAQRAERDVDDAVHVVERQHEHRAVVGRPLPGREHPVDHGGEAAVRVHRPLRPSRRAARVHHHRRTLGARAEAVDRAASRHVDDDGVAGDPVGDVPMGAGGDDRRRPAVGQHVPQLGVGMRRVERDGDGPGVPAGEQGDDEVVARSAATRRPGRRARSGQRRRAPSRRGRAWRTSTRRRGSTIATRSPERADAVGERVDHAAVSIIGGRSSWCPVTDSTARAMRRDVDVAALRPDELEPDRQPVAVEAGGERQGGAAGDGDAPARRHPIDVRLDTWCRRSPSGTPTRRGTAPTG